MFGTEANQAAVEQLGLKKDARIIYASLNASHMQDHVEVFAALMRIRHGEEAPHKLDLKDEDDRVDLELAIQQTLKTIKLPKGHFIVGAAPDETTSYADTTFGLVDLTAFPELWLDTKEESSDDGEDPYKVIADMQDQLETVIESMRIWHQTRVAQLQLVVDNDGAVIQLGDLNIEPGTDVYKGIRAGIKIALDLFNPPPITVTGSDEAEEAKS